MKGAMGNEKWTNQPPPSKNVTDNRKATYNMPS